MHPPLAPAPVLPRILFALAIVLLVVSCIGLQYPFDTFLQHILTVAFLVALAVIHHRSPISNLSCILLFVYLLLHFVGARYLYSNVPYDQWSAAIFGTSISEAFGLERNHYDRFVHFCFGLIALYPLRELVMRYLNLKPFAALVVAIAFHQTISSLYELMEWLIAVIMSPDAAERYNGQQGDMWDAHKDAGLALIGCLIASPVILLTDRYTQKQTASTSRHRPNPTPKPHPHAGIRAN